MIVKHGMHGITIPRTTNVIGTALIQRGPFANIKGEIIGRRNGHMQYLTIQVPAEFVGRVYVLNLLHSQCKDIIWRYN